MIQLSVEVSIISETRVPYLSIEEILRIIANLLGPIGAWEVLSLLLLKIRALKASWLQDSTQIMSMMRALALILMRFMMIDHWRLDNKLARDWNNSAPNLTVDPLKKKILEWEWMIGCRRCANKADMLMAWSSCMDYLPKLMRELKVLRASSSSMSCIAIARRIARLESATMTVDVWLSKTSQSPQSIAHLHTISWGRVPEAQSKAWLAHIVWVSVIATQL